MKKDYFIFWANMPGLVLGLYYCLSILPFLSKKVNIIIEKYKVVVLVIIIIVITVITITFTVYPLYHSQRKRTSVIIIITKKHSVTFIPVLLKCTYSLIYLFTLFIFLPIFFIHQFIMLSIHSNIHNIYNIYVYNRTLHQTRV